MPRTLQKWVQHNNLPQVNCPTTPTYLSCCYLPYMTLLPYNMALPMFLLLHMTTMSV